MGTHRAVIVDIDGTLCDVRSARELLVGPTRDFDAFHAAAEFCPANTWVLAWCQQQREAGRALLLLTGRPERHRASTQRWLDKMLPADWFEAGTPAVVGPLMRADGDYRCDSVFKREAHEWLTGHGYRITGAIDDRPRVLALWRELGLEPVVVDCSADWAAAGEPYTERDFAALARQRENHRKHSAWVSPEVASGVTASVAASVAAVPESEPQSRATQSQW